MNANEVICNRALQIMGHGLGEYQYLHPADHVNMGQSTNDVYPTALDIAAIESFDALDAAMAELIAAFDDKATEFARMVKMGRTQLQDAVPMTLGQEMRSYAVTIGEDRQRLAEASALLHEINMGGTAIGTRLNAPPGYVEAVCQNLRAITGRPLTTAVNLIEATQDPGAFVQVSSVLKRISVKLSKICNDLRLLSSGPRAGLNEINLPAVQAGSSIMPGKVNPVIPEVVTQVCYAVIGNDLTITMAAEAGQLQLNAFEPIIAHSLFDSVEQLTAACRTLTTRCVRGITANVGHHGCARAQFDRARHGAQSLHRLRRMPPRSPGTPCSPTAASRTSPSSVDTSPRSSFGIFWLRNVWRTSRWRPSRCPPTCWRPAIEHGQSQLNATEPFAER